MFGFPKIDIPVAGSNNNEESSQAATIPLFTLPNAGRVVEQQHQQQEKVLQLAEQLKQLQQKTGSISSSNTVTTSVPSWISEQVHDPFKTDFHIATAIYDPTDFEDKEEEEEDFEILPTKKSKVDTTSPTTTSKKRKQDTQLSALPSDSNLSSNVAEFLKNSSSFSTTTNNAKPKQFSIEVLNQVPTANQTTDSTSHFTLEQQPSQRQRKCYKNESRYLLPNPIVIKMKESSRVSLPRILRGRVSVELVDKDGQAIQGGGGSQILEGILSKELDASLSAQFSLKILSTSNGNMFRLLFRIKYDLEGRGTSEEQLLSSSFLVYSNKKKSMKEPPAVYGMKPHFGSAKEPTEVWIKGNNFSDSVQVNFGGQWGKVTEVEDNIITVIVPPRNDLTETTSIIVDVFSNGIKGNYIDKKLSFTYYVSGNNNFPFN